MGEGVTGLGLAIGSKMGLGKRVKPKVTFGGN